MPSVSSIATTIACVIAMIRLCTFSYALAKIFLFRLSWVDSISLLWWMIISIVNSVTNLGDIGATCCFIFLFIIVVVIIKCRGCLPPYLRKFMVSSCKWLVFCIVLIWNNVFLAICLEEWVLIISTAVNNLVTTC